MKQIIKAIATASLFAVCLSASAQRSGLTAGIGVSECGQYLRHRQMDKQDYDADQTAIYAVWVHGFFSAYNTMSNLPPMRSIPERPTIIAHLDKYCRDNPTHTVYAGTICLIGDTGGWKAKNCKQ